MKKKVRGPVFSRDELIIALDQYLSRLCSIDARDSLIIIKAALIGRSPASFVFKMLNFQYVITKSKGFKHGGKGEREIWSEFKDNREGLRDAAKSILDKLYRKKPKKISEYAKAVGERLRSIRKTETKHRLSKSREYSADIRLIALENFNHRCAICDIDIIELLDAAHIIPYHKDIKKRFDPSNILCLCVLHHRAFDREIITIDKDGVVRLGSTRFTTKKGPIITAGIYSVVGERVRKAKIWEPIFI